MLPNRWAVPYTVILAVCTVITYYRSIALRCLTIALWRHHRPIEQQSSDDVQQHVSNEHESLFMNYVLVRRCEAQRDR